MTNGLIWAPTVQALRQGEGAVVPRAVAAGSRSAVKDDKAEV